MPAPSVKFDLVRLADIRNTIYGMEIKRGVQVKDLPIVMNPTYGADPTMLLKSIAVPGFPQLLEPFPDPSVSFLTVKEQNFKEYVRKDCLKFEIVYRGNPGGNSAPTWTVRDGFTVSYVPTYTTAYGSNALKMWYKKGQGGHSPVNAAGLPVAIPVGAQLKAGKTHKPVSHRSVTAIALVNKDYWATVKNNFRAMAGTINHDNWNGANRGQWYYVGPESTTQDLGAQVTVKNTFLFDPLGWFTTLAWFTHLGEHPVDCTNEGAMRLVGLPAEDDIMQGNGLTICSVLGETNFNTFFSGIVL